MNHEDTKSRRRVIAPRGMRVRSSAGISDASDRQRSNPVIPAKAGTQRRVPAFAGMTGAGQSSERVRIFRRVGFPVIASSHRPSADPRWMKSARTVMAGLVPAICGGRVPRPMAGTSPAMTMKCRRSRTGFLVGRAKQSPFRCAPRWRLCACLRAWPWGRLAPNTKPSHCEPLRQSRESGNPVFADHVPRSWVPAFAGMTTVSDAGQTGFSFIHSGSSIAGRCGTRNDRKTRTFRLRPVT
jgi:hypothetical protein